MKKAICLFTALVLLFGVCAPAFALEYSGTVNAEQVVLMNSDSGEILFEKGGDDPVDPMAATKLLSALTALDSITDLSATVTLDSDTLDGDYESDALLEEDDVLTVDQLMTLMLLSDASDPAVALANYVSGDPDTFTEQMNAKAASLQMTGSAFVNPHGEADENQHTTAKDLALLGSAAASLDLFQAMLSRVNYEIPAGDNNHAYSVENPNLLMHREGSGSSYHYSYATGLLAWTDANGAGCLIATAQQGGTRLTCVILGDKSNGQNERWTLAQNLMEEGFNYTIGDSTSPQVSRPQTTTPSTGSQSTTPPSAETQPGDQRQENPEHQSMLMALIALAAISCVLAVASIIMLMINIMSRHRPNSTQRIVSIALYVVTALVALVTILCVLQFRHLEDTAYFDPVPSTSISTEVPTTEATEPPTAAPTSPPTTAEPTTAPTEPPDPLLTFHPHHTENTDPDNFDINWEIIIDDEIVDSYQRENPIVFGKSDDYAAALPCIASFRGDNFRTGSTYGTAKVSDKTISWDWNVPVGSCNGWSGCGWTGQPLLVQWDNETKQIMNLYQEKKDKENLVEVIYATLDGYIYFLDLDDGSYTRDRMYIGMNFKGAGAIDPRGYPLLYVGSGDYVDYTSPRMYIISLIDCTVLAEMGYNESHTPRSWNAYDSSPLVCGNTDTLIWPGENGQLYTIALNTRYDKRAGTISVDPKVEAKASYSPDRFGSYSYWVGMEASCVVVGSYLYVSENGGLFFCVDLNTMALVWVQDTMDDSNSTPVFEWGDDNNGYIYTAPSLHWTAEGSWGEISIYKLDAQTGEIIWEHPWDCGTVEEVSGGVQSSPVLGRKGTDIEGLIIYSISRTPDLYDGKLVAFHTADGSVAWECDLPYYGWSSTSAVYDESGKVYLIQACSDGTVYLIDGATGEKLDHTDLGSTIEATPAVWEDKVVLGTRGASINMMIVS